MMIQHNFSGPGPLCDRCNCLAKYHQIRHRIYHAPVGDPCTQCQRPASEHPSKAKLDKFKARDRSRHGRSSDIILGIDGEGHDLPDGRHIYTLLMAVDESGRVVGEAYNAHGLTPQEAMAMLLTLPKNALKFIFMGSYDWTKMIEGLSELDIYYIMHPDLRRMRACRECGFNWRTAEKECPRCAATKVRAVNLLRYVSEDKAGKPFRLGLDWFNGSFSVAEPAPIDPNIPRNNREKPKSRWLRKTKVWDCFKFFQCSFVKAIRQWDVGTKTQQDRIEEMKKKRGAFADEKPEDVRAYCKEECQLLAIMMRKVIVACHDAGIELTAYHGAGSIASAFMKLHKIKDFMGPSIEFLPHDLQYAIMAAYFGGRFENSIVGEVKERVYNRDIFSAYPYAIAQLPCLTCGTWEYHPAETAISAARAGRIAIVKFRMRRAAKAERQRMAWCPLPCREDSGSICYPTGFHGWAWLPELESALRGWADMIAIEGAWVYTTKCEHTPFSWVPDAYRKRFEWGKDGRGIVMKLGLNACAGKTMQTEGDPPPFRSHIWGGMITATTRSQSLDAILAAKDPWNVLGIATDGAFTTEVLDLPPPKDTGVNDLEKPLGGWGCDPKEGLGDGVFFVKPGMYFALVPDEEKPRPLMRARGVGRDEMGKTAIRLIRAFQAWDRKSELLINVKSRRFFGAKSSVLLYSGCSKCKTAWPGPPSKLCPTCSEIGDTCRSQVMRMNICEACNAPWPNLSEKRCSKCQATKHVAIPAYGRWAERSINIEFEPHPKRETIASLGTFARMRIRDMRGKESVPYVPGNTTPLGKAAKLAAEEGLEAPEWFDEDIDEDEAVA
jgi:hypothetical protein